MEQNIKLFDKIETDGGKNLQKYLKKSKLLYDTAMKDLIMIDYDNWNLPWIKILKVIGIIPIFGNFHNEVSKFIKNKDLQKILEFTTVFLGGSPFNTPSLYSLMSHTDMGLGLWYPMGGMNKIFEMLYKLGKDAGVKYELNTEVKQVITKNQVAIGVETVDKVYDADMVVSGADYSFTETKLLKMEDQTYSENYWRKKILSPGALVIYLGLNKKTKLLEHHNLYFSDEWEKGFDEVFGSNKWPLNPSYYVHVPSKTDKSVAPSSGETLMILVPVAPYLKDDDKTREEFSNKIIKHLEKISGEKITENIVVKRIFSHRDFIKDYNSRGGAAFGLAHTLTQSAIFRPKNRSRKVKNLYYAGQSTNPGVGVPIGILSAMICRNIINRRENGQ